MKTKTQFTCTSCGHQTPKWMGQCPGCRSWNTLQEETTGGSSNRWSRKKSAAGMAKVKRLSEIDDEKLVRYRTGIEEFDRVLGGGVVPGSLILVAGDPGIGKSTLLLQAASAFGHAGLQVLYISAEESERQLRMRSRRLGAVHESIRVLASTRLEEAAAVAEGGDIDLIMVDSVQTIYHGDDGSPPGSVAQVRENTLYFMELAKRSQVPVLLVGHVTKEGTVAGPRVLEHMVDAVMYLEGDPFSHYRVLRAAKNRFGATHEVGVFDMGEGGLQEVVNPSEFLLAERREGTSGSAVVVALEGTRPLLMEVQALVGNAGYGSPRRVATGIDSKRLSVLLAVLERRAGLNLSTSDVFVNVAGGLRIAEPAVDLALAVAVASSYYDIPVDPRMVLMGEVGLGGEVRRVNQLPLRLREASKLGFESAVVPERGWKKNAAAPLRLEPVERVDEALKVLFPDADPRGRPDPRARADMPANPAVVP